jgi:hypothetical protein
MDMILRDVSAYRSRDVYSNFLRHQQDWEDNVIQKMNRLQQEKEIVDANKAEQI